MFFHQALQQSRAKERNWKAEEGRLRERKNIKECNTERRRERRQTWWRIRCGGEEGGSLGLHARKSHNGFPAICILANADGQKHGLASLLKCFLLVYYSLSFFFLGENFIISKHSSYQTL